MSLKLLEVYLYKQTWTNHRMKRLNSLSKPTFWVIIEEEIAVADLDQEN